MIAVFEKASKIVETRNLGWQNKWLRLPVECEVVSRACALVVGFTQSLDLNFANRLANPLGGPRLRCAKENLCRGLRQHGFSIFAVAGLHLAPSLETKDDWALRFPIFGDGGMEFGKRLKDSNFVVDNPDGFLVG